MNRHSLQQKTYQQLLRTLKVFSKTTCLVMQNARSSSAARKVGRLTQFRLREEWFARILQSSLQVYRTRKDWMGLNRSLDSHMMSWLWFLHWTRRAINLPRKGIAWIDESFTCLMVHCKAAVNTNPFHIGQKIILPCPSQNWGRFQRAAYMHWWRIR